MRAIGRDHAVGREGSPPSSALCRRRLALIARQLHDAAQHLDEGAGDRQVRPGRLGRDVEQDERALAARRAGDQRRAVGKARPGALGDVGRGFGQHLPRHGHLGRRRRGRRRGRSAGKSVHGLRFGPGQGAAERALAGAQAHRQEIVVVAGGRQPRAGKAHQRAAVFDPVDQLRARTIGNGADIGHDDHRRLLGDEVGDGDDEIGLAAVDRSAKGCERVADVVERRQERLRLVGLGLRQQTDAAALGVVVEQAHGGGLGLAVDARSRRNRCAVRRAPSAVRWRWSRQRRRTALASAMRRPLSSKAPAVTLRGAASPGGRMAVRAKPSTAFSAAVRPTSRKIARRRPDDAAGLAGKERLESLLVVPRRQVRRTAWRPSRPAAPSAPRRRGQRPPGGRSGWGAARWRASLPRAASASKGPMSALGFSAVKASSTGAPAVAASSISRSAVAARRSQSGALDQPLSTTSARPAAAGRHPVARVEHGFGQGEHDEGGQQQAQQRQPPRAAVRRFLAPQHLRQDAQRREDFALRLRRRQPQQPPDDRQREQAPEHGGEAEGEGQPAHARPPAA